MVRQPARRPASISRQRSPTTKLLARSAPKLFLGAQYHARFRLAAVATLLVVVLAHLDPVERQNGRELPIDLIDVNAVCAAARDIGLVGDDNQHKAFVLQFVERSAGAGCDDELTQITWRLRPAVADDD